MSRKRETSLEDYLALLFEERKDLEGLPIDTVLPELNNRFNLKVKYRTLSLIYEPIIEFETVYEEEEDFYEEN